MKKFVSIIIAVLVFAFTCASIAATSKKVGIENPENAKQGIVPDKAKVKDNQTKAKTDKATSANVGKKVEKKDVQQKK